MSFCCTLENKQNPSHVSAKQNAVKTFFLDKVRFSLLPSPHRSDRCLKPPLNASLRPNISALRKQQSSEKFRASKHPDQLSVGTSAVGASAAPAGPAGEHVPVSSGGADPAAWLQRCYLELQLLSHRISIFGKRLPSHTTSSLTLYSLSCSGRLITAQGFDGSKFIS